MQQAGNFNHSVMDHQFLTKQNFKTNHQQNGRIKIHFWNVKNHLFSA